MSGTGDGGRFGTWSEDADGLVAFDYALADGPAGLELPAGDGRRPWHQVGNDRLVATAHAGGWTTLYVTDRAYMRLSDLDPTRPRGLGGRFRVRLPDGRAVLDPFGPPAAPPVEVTTRWGTGYAEWTVVEVEGPASLRRRVWAPHRLPQEPTLQARRGAAPLWPLPQEQAPTPGSMRNGGRYPRSAQQAEHPTPRHRSPPGKAAPTPPSPDSRPPRGPSLSGQPESPTATSRQ